MRQTLSLVIALAATLMGAVSAEAQITWTRQTSGYPTLSHTDGRLGLGAYTNESDGSMYRTAAIVATPNNGGPWRLDEIAGIGSGMASGFPSLGTWIVDVYSSTSSMQSNSIGDLGSGTVSLIGSPVSFGSQDRAGNSWEAFYARFDVSGLNLSFSSGSQILISLRNHNSEGAWGWNETDLASGFGPDPFITHAFPGEVHYWTEFGRPTGVAALDFGFTQPVPEPSTCILLASGIAAFLSRKRSRIQP